MAYELTAHAILQNGMCFDAETGSCHHIILDAADSNGGEDKGPRPMELFLVALASCAGMDIISILRKKRQQISGYEVRVHGDRMEEHPRMFVNITVEHLFTGHDLHPAAIERAIALTEERYCAASVIMSKSAKVLHTFRIIEQ